MMDLEKILKKRKPTGKEVGWLLLKHSAYIHRHEIDPTVEPPFDPDILDDLVHMIVNGDEKNESDCSKYNSLGNGLAEAVKMRRTVYQQTEHGYYRLLSYLNSILYSMEYRHMSEGNPLIITDAKYNEILDSYANWIGKEPYSYIDVFMDGITYFIEHPDKRDTELAAIFEAYKKKPIDNSALIDFFMSTKPSTFINDDGTRADDLEADVQTAKNRDRIREEYFKPILTGNADSATTERMLKAAALMNRRDFMEAAVTETGKKITQDLMHFVKVREYNDYREYLDHNEPVTYYKALELGYRGIVERVEALTEDIVRNVYISFKGIFPELTEYMQRYIERLDIEAFKGMKPADFAKQVVKLRMLSHLDVFGYREFLDPTNEEIVEALNIKDPELKATSMHKAKKNGLSVVVGAPASRVDKYGIMHDLTQKYDTTVISMEDIENINESPEVLQFLQKAYRLINGGMQYHYIYIEMLKILSDIYQVPELTDLIPVKIMEALENRISDNFNCITSYIRESICYDDKEKEAAVKANFDLCFPKIYLDSLKPTDQMIKKMSKELQFKTTKDQLDHYMMRLDFYIYSKMNREYWEHEA